jgi:molybdopterin/thiamine biosynthesis adenylyltransferase
MRDDDRFSRQSFLGVDAEDRIARVTVGIVGLGGGGSHIVQQLAHVGFRNYVIYDGDAVEESNLNRLVGGTAADVNAKTSKAGIAERQIRGLLPTAAIRSFSSEWQQEPAVLRECQIVFGCVDSYRGRAELEVACRRYLMHYVDVGMDVHGSTQPTIGGQVILSSPGGPCMRCLGFLNDEKIAREAALYGNAGPRPQVIWPNGVLASTAVGLGVDLVTNWTRKNIQHAYLVYEGNTNSVKESVTLLNFKFAKCEHYSETDIGDPVLTEL